MNLSKKRALRLVARHIAERSPLAVVRFGEGEGRLLAAEPGDRLSEKVAIKKLRRQTGLTFTSPEMFKVKALVMRAFDEADFVGLGVTEKFADEHREWGERIAAIYEQRVALGRKEGYVTHCMLNSDLYRELPALLAGQEKVSVISCRDVEEALESRFGVGDAAVHQVPSQYVVRDVDDDYEAALHEVAIWPDFYRELRERIEVRDRGEIFLVGAGLFGKELCIRVRELGGIALDMGSTLDAMAGKVTRGKRRPQFRAFPKTPKVV